MKRNVDHKHFIVTFMGRRERECVYTLLFLFQVFEHLSKGYVDLSIEFP